MEGHYSNTFEKEWKCNEICMEVNEHLISRKYVLCTKKNFYARLCWGL